MSEKKYKVIQWATGTVGKVALKHFIENPTFELVGVLVTNPDKVGKDAGELVGLPATGIKATNDVEKIMALQADCVHYAPMMADIKTICRLLRSGKNVVSVGGPFSRTERYRAQFDEIESAGQDGKTSFHGCGIHPGYVSDILPITLTRLMDRVDCIKVYEIADKLKSPSVYIESMGFGREPESLLAKPSRSAEAPHFFAQSMTMVAQALGKKIENLTTKLKIATTKKDIPYPNGVIRAGTVAAQHWEWTGWADGAPLIVYHFYYSMGSDFEPYKTPPDIEQGWKVGDSGYRIVIEGNPPLEMRLAGLPDADGKPPFLGIIWTSLLGVTAIPQVCEAKPGVITHIDLGVVQPQGLVRR